MTPSGHLRLPRPLIPTLMILAAGEHAPTPADGAVRHLEELELAAQGRITPMGRRLVEIMTEADLVISVECASAELVQHSTIWAQRHRAVWGRPADHDVFELRCVEPIEIPLLLAQLTEVGHRPPAPFAGAVTVPHDALNAAASRDFDAETAFGILVAAGVDSTWADRLLIAFDHRRHEFTISSVWTDPEGNHGHHEVRILDAGAAGYWHLEPDTHSGSITATVGSVRSVMRSLTGCVPAWCAAPV